MKIKKYFKTSFWFDCIFILLITCILQWAKLKLSIHVKLNVLVNVASKLLDAWAFLELKMPILPY